jgi:hypothetical protein
MFSSKEKKESDEQSKNAQSFRHGKSKDQTAELTVSGRWIAKGTVQELAEQCADTDGCGTGSDCGKARANHFCCFYFHEKFSL